MTDKQNAERDALIPSGERALITQSVGLARRGLELAGNVLGASPVRVLLVDDIPYTLEVLRGFLHGQADIEIVGYARNGVEAIKQYDALLPDVMTTCIHMPVMDGISATREICRRHPNANVIILTVRDETEFRQRAMSAGAKLYLVKPVSAEEFTSAIRAVGWRAMASTRRTI